MIAVNKTDSTNLRNLNIIRLIVLTLELVGLLCTHFYFGIEIDWQPVSLIFGLSLGLVVYTHWRNTQVQKSISSTELFFHLVADTALQTSLLYYCGGYTNPLISVYLVPVSISALLLAPKQRWTITALCILCYTLLQSWYQPLMPMGHGMHSDHGMSAMVLFHLTGMWITFTVSACLVTGIVAPMADSLRTHRAKVAENREQQLRSERILSVAITAAGAAHELGTPLSTMSVLLKDMSEEHKDSAPLSDDIALLRSQIALCKKRLTSIVNNSQTQQAARQSAKAFVLRVLDEWQLLRPSVKVEPLYADNFSGVIQADQALEMALINLLNNAADASPNFVEVSLRQTSDSVILQIRDKGESLAESVSQSPGFITSSSKRDGLGLGLQLSAATIESQGGIVRLYKAEPVGTITEIQLQNYSRSHLLY